MHTTDHASAIAGGIIGAHAHADKVMTDMEESARRRARDRYVADQSPQLYTTSYDFDEYERRELKVEVRYYAKQDAWSYALDGQRCTRATALDSIRQGRPMWDTRYLYAGMRG